MATTWAFINGTAVSVPPAAIHRDEKFYSNQDEYDAFRFVTTAEAKGNMVNANGALPEGKLSTPLTSDTFLPCSLSLMVEMLGSDVGERLGAGTSPLLYVASLAFCVTDLNSAQSPGRFYAIHQLRLVLAYIFVSHNVKLLAAPSRSSSSAI